MWNVDANLFWLFQTWPVTLRIQEQGFSACNVLPDTKEVEPGSGNQKGLSGCKNTSVVLAPHGNVSLRLFLMVCTFSRFLDVICCNRGVLNRSYKNYFKDRFLQFLPFLSNEMVLLSKTFEANNFESHEALKLSIINIWGLCYNFVCCGSVLESNSPDILALCETNSDYLNSVWRLLCEGRASSNLKGFCLLNRTYL